MAGNSQARNAELVRALLDGVGRHLKDGKSALARGFVESCYDGVAYEDMLEMSPADLEGSALGLFEFAYRRRRGQSKVRVYNPTARRHGWHATHTVVELVNPDRPFLVDSIIAALNRLDLTVHLLIHPVIRVRRDSGGHLIAVGEAEGRRESVVQVQVSQQLSRGRLKEIEAELRTAPPAPQPPLQSVSSPDGHLHTCCATTTKALVVSTASFLAACTIPSVSPA